MLLAASRGVLLGACVGLLLALNDFGATWLWLDMGRDRFALLVRLLGIEVPVFAGLGAVGAVVVRSVGGQLAPRLPASLARDRWAHALALVLSPGCAWIAWQMYAGGSASRLPATGLLKPLTALALVVAVWRVATLTFRIVPQPRSARAALIVGAALVAGSQLLVKLNQWVLPNLYDYLHATTTLATGAGMALALAIVAPQVARWTELERRWPLLGALALFPLSLLLLSSVNALAANQNVAVAMLDPRAIHARTLLVAAGPWLRRTVERRPIEHAQRAPQRAAIPTRAVPDAGSRRGTHVLLITIDALRADHLGIYGYARATSPKIDQLAAESWVFERAYAQAPHSSYSLSSLMTSEYLHETLDLGAAAPEQTLATLLANAGYHTAAFYTLGIFHTAAERLSSYENNAFGFALHDHQDREPEALTDRVLQEVDRSIGQGEPDTFIWAHYFNVHEPYRATTFGTADMDRYDSEILRADAAVDRLVRETRRRFSRDVIVVLTADHGEEFREHGGVYHGSALYEEQVRVPLILSAPGLAPRRIQASAEIVDIAPTLLGLVNVAAAPSMRGDDLRLVADHEADAPPAFSAVIHKRMVVSWPYKLIADLRFGLFELYDLSSDPRERTNLANRAPEQVSALRDEIYGWLDGLAPLAEREDPRTLAIDQGRLGDRRAVPTLVELIQDENAPTSTRREAGAILGKLADVHATSGLVAALASADPMVAAEAAIALGRMQHEGAHAALKQLVLSEDPDLRARAAVSLGRLRDPAAIPALIDTLWIAPSDYEREEAIRWLGRLRDPRALEPLISLLPESRTRHLVVVALGTIGDDRAFDTLADVLRWEDHANVRDHVVRGFGMLKDARALTLLLPLATREGTLKHLSESLVRLGAIEAREIGGIDFRRGARMQGFHRCSEFSERHDWDYLHRTLCETSRATASAALSIPDKVAGANAGSDVVMAVRRVDGQTPALVTLQIGDQRLAPVPVDGTWSEPRWTLPAGALHAGSTRAQLSSDDPKARFALDHILVFAR